MFCRVHRCSYWSDRPAVENTRQYRCYARNLASVFIAGKSRLDTAVTPNGNSHRVLRFWFMSAFLHSLTVHCIHEGMHREGPSDVNPLVHLAEFMSRSNRYSTLKLSSDASSSYSKKIVLVKDLPAMVFTNLDEWHGMIQ